MGPLASFIGDLEEQHRWKRSRPASWWNLFVLCPVLAVVVWCFYSGYSRSQVASRQHFAIGLVDTHDPSNHDRYGYTFSVGKQKFKGWAYPASYRDFHLGESITVYYDPSDPDTNSPSDFHEINTGTSLILSWCLLVAAGIPLSIFLQRRVVKRAEAKCPSG
jgi:hypothetical protein